MKATKITTVNLVEKHLLKDIVWRRTFSQLIEGSESNKWKSNLLVYMYLIPYSLYIRYKPKENKVV